MSRTEEIFERTHEFKGIVGTDFDFLIARVRRLEKALHMIMGHAGCPDAAEGCRIIIKAAQEALSDEK